MKNLRRNKIIKMIVSLVLASVLFCSTLFGCSFAAETLSSLEFNVTKISMELGDEVDVYDYLDIKPASSFASIELLSDNEKIVDSSTSLKALSVGRTKIKASGGGKASYCNVEVSYKEPKNLQLFEYGSLFQERNYPVYVDFAAIVDEYINPNYEIEWYVGGTRQAVRGKYFSFLPQIKGSHVITAKMIDDDGNEISDSRTVFLYEPLQNIEPLSAASISNGIKLVSQTVGYWEFFVNGEPAANMEAAAEWEFLPTSDGIYSLTASLFGKPVVFEDGSYEYVYTKNGSIKPSNLSLEYDNCYPDSYISWEIENVNDISGFEFFVKITDTNGISYEYSSATHPALFDGTRFDSSNAIFIAKQYTIEVCCAKGEDFNNSQKASITTTAVPSEALTYLSQKYLDKNYYITSDEEFYDIYEYTLWMRKDKTKSNGITSSTMKVFMSYDSEYNGGRLSRRAFSRSGQSGIYYLDKPIGSATKNSTLSVKIGFDGDNTPTKKTATSNIPATLLKPHISFEAKADRAFAIDEMPLASDIVSTSNELYYIVERGFRPNIQAGSSAEKLYDYAKETLEQIISDDMGRLEKIHAIYDWILWRTHYDRKVEQVTDLEEAVKYAPYYLESVLNNDYPFSVCDGISKTFSLLANMEGIKCVRVVGKADSSGFNNWGEHAWNKVYIDNSWYLVDCTWGDNVVLIDGISYESSAHQYLMLSSGEMSETHRENALGSYPQAETKPYIFFRRNFHHENNSASLYFFENSDAVITSKATTLVDYVLATKPDSSTYTVGENAPTTVYYYGTDFFVATYLTLTVKSKIIQILQSRGILGDFVVESSGEYMYLLIKY